MRQRGCLPPYLSLHDRGSDLLDASRRKTLAACPTLPYALQPVATGRQSFRQHTAERPATVSCLREAGSTLPPCTFGLHPAPVHRASGPEPEALTPPPKGEFRPAGTSHNAGDCPLQQASGASGPCPFLCRTNLTPTRLPSAHPFLPRHPSRSRSACHQPRPATFRLRASRSECLQPHRRRSRSRRRRASPRRDGTLKTIRRLASFCNRRPLWHRTHHR